MNFIRHPIALFSLAVSILTTVVGCSPLRLDPDFRTFARLLEEQSKKEKATAPGISRREAMERSQVTLASNPEYRRVVAAMKAKHASTVDAGQAPFSLTPSASSLPPVHSKLAGTDWRVQPEAVFWPCFNMSLNTDGTITIYEVNADKTYTGQWQHQGNTVAWASPAGIRFEGTLEGEVLTGKLTNKANQTTNCRCITGEKRRLSKIATEKAQDEQYAGIAKAVTKFARGFQTPASGGAGISGSPAGGGSAPQGSEIERFKNHFRNRDVSFLVVHDDCGGLVSSDNLILKDASTGKKFAVSYTYGLSKGLDGMLSMEGKSVEIRFSRDGTPQSIKNLANGRSFELGNWKVSGYGW